MSSPAEANQFVVAAQHAFGVTPDPRFLFMSQTHRESIEALDQGIQRNRGFFVVLGSAGTGKTTLLYRLMEKYRTVAETGFVFQTQGTSGELLRHIAADLGVAPSNDSVELANRIRDLLVATHRQGKSMVIIIDEAQNLSSEALETVRLLSNYETSNSKLLQIILAGQEWLADRLLAPELVQLAQRIAMVRRLHPLSQSEVYDYIEHRLSVVGVPPGIFHPSAVSALALRSEGIPRNINRLCYSALCQAENEGRTQVDADMILRLESDTLSELRSISAAVAKSRAATQPAAATPLATPATPAVETPPAKMPVRSVPVPQPVEQLRAQRPPFIASAALASQQPPRTPSAPDVRPQPLSIPNYRSQAAVELRTEKPLPVPPPRIETRPASHQPIDIARPLPNTAAPASPVMKPKAPVRMPVAAGVSPRFLSVSIDDRSTHTWITAGVILALLLGMALIIGIPKATPPVATTVEPAAIPADPQPVDPSLQPANSGLKKPRAAHSSAAAPVTRTSGATTGAQSQHDSEAQP